ncbi:hypothetical protein VV869_23820 [Photobacterium sp. MCCC 1A19761]|uniref:hypothetical protein n=1 Tax=Photobacterium sp. MCCC 1A19761 TaxID=3115000 RepID=UPI00307EA680
MSFLETYTHQLNGQVLLLTELSGLDRFSHIEYCGDLQVQAPEKPEDVADDASLVEREKYLLELTQWKNAWDRLAFESQVSLVAYGLRDDERLQNLESVELRRDWVWNNLSPKAVTEIHNKVAEMSGMVIEVAEESDAADLRAEEPIDPKG